MNTLLENVAHRLPGTRLKKCGMCLMAFLIIGASLWSTPQDARAADPDPRGVGKYINWSQSSTVQLVRHNLLTGVCKKRASDGGCDYVEHCKDFQQQFESLDDCTVVGAGPDINNEVFCEFSCP